MTKDMIITAAEKLFIEKGFEKVSIQDIANETKLSKGAIYHHYKSKDDIIKQFIERHSNMQRKMLMEIIDSDDGRTAKELFINLMEKIFDLHEDRLKEIPKDYNIKSPDIVYTHLQRSMMGDAPVIAKLIERGNQDSSFSVESPLECAEVFLILVNVWLDVSIVPCTQDKLRKKALYLQHVLRTLGMDVFTDSVIDRMIRFCCCTKEREV